MAERYGFALQTAGNIKRCEMLINDEKFTLVGAGAEGTVYRISDNLVAKCWHNIVGVSENTPQAVFARYQKVLSRIPEELREVVTVPEIAGGEMGDDGKVITYHEYIQNDFDERLINSVAKKGLFTHFTDWFGDNVQTMRGRVYLVDVWPFGE